MFQRIYLIFFLTTLFGSFRAEQMDYLINPKFVNQCSEAEKQIIDRNLTAFHNTKDPSHICKLIDESNDINIWPRYNQFLRGYCKNHMMDSTRYIKTDSVWWSYIGYYHMIQGIYYRKKGDIHMAIQHHHHANKIYLSFRNFCLSSKMYMRLSKLFSNLYNYDVAKQYANHALRLGKDCENQEVLAHMYLWMSYYYSDIGDLAQSIQLLGISNKLYEAVHNQDGVVRTEIAIADAQMELGNTKEALNSLYEVKKKAELLPNNRPLSLAYLSLFELYVSQKNAILARLYQDTISTIEYIHDEELLRSRYLRVCAKHLINENRLDSAIQMISSALNIGYKVGNHQDIAKSTFVRADIFHKQGLYAESNDCLKSYLSNSSSKIKMKIYHLMQQNYAKLGQMNKAYEALLAFNMLHDSLLKSKAEMSLVELELNQKFKEEKTRIESIHKKSVKKAEDENRNQQMVSLMIAGLTLVILILTYVIWRRLKFSRKQNKIIEKTNVELKKQKEIILQKSKQILQNRNQLETKNKEMTSSLRYAKRLQKTLLSTGNALDNCNHEILYLPKDLVSGDFYWAKKHDSVLKVAVADCTGHGIPGALLSVLGMSYLNEMYSNLYADELNPDQVLGILKEKVVEEFGQHNTSSKDGMDISIAHIDYMQNKLHWSGANHNLLFIQNVTANPKLTEVKGTKQPIGYSNKSTLFDLHTLEFNKGDFICLYTDGFADQFGGPKDKKFQTSKLKSFVLSNIHLPIDQQIERLKLAFYAWKGDAEQIDDVTVLLLEL